LRNSADRILTTHTGSLPRPPAVTQLFLSLSRREPVDDAAQKREVEAATRHVVARQREVGIDVANDGEQSRESFITYVQHRLSGYGGESNRPVPRDIITFPTFVQAKAPDFSKPSVTLMRAPKAVGEVRHVRLGPLNDECDLFDRVAAEGAPFAERFLTAASPGIVCAAMMNEHYASDDDYVVAVADALRPEYQRIVERGYVLQIDAPDLAMERHTSYADRSLEDFQAYVRRNIAAINRAIEGLPADRIRLHACWATTKRPTTSTWTSTIFCRCYTEQMLARWSSPSLTRVMPTSSAPSSATLCRMAGCSWPG